MTIEQIKEMVAGSEYDFLRTNPHLKDRIIFLTLGGSYSYSRMRCMACLLRWLSSFFLFLWFNFS